MWDTLADDTALQQTIASLKKNGIDAMVADSATDAKSKVIALIPKGAEVMTMTSVTLTDTGIEKELNESGNYDSVKEKIKKMDRATQSKEMQALGTAPDWAVGSVHAVTQDGQVMVASNTGSQLPAYAYGSQHVVWVVGTQKIVKNLDDGMKRIYEYTLPLESERAKKAYGMERSNVSKMLVVNKEVAPGRITVVFVKEKLGF